MIESAIKWSAISLFVALAYTDNLQPSVAGPVQEAGSRIVQAGNILFAGGCETVFRCEKVLKDVSNVDVPNVEITVSDE